MKPYQPRALLTIESATGQALSLDSRLNHLMALTVSKGLGQAEGKWQASLRDARPDGSYWSKVLHANDLVKIALGHDGETQPVMTGLIDQISQGETVEGDGRRVLTCQLSGSDLAKLFTRFKLSTSYLINEKNEYGQMGELQNLQAELFGDNMEIPKMVEAAFTYLKRIAAVRIRFGSWKGASWLDLVKVSCTSPYHILGSVPMTYSGPVWGLLTELASPPFHEMWLDTYGGENLLTIRPTPYSDLSALPEPITIQPSDWLQREVALSDAEVVNVVFVLTRFINEYQPIMDPAIDGASMDLFGLRERTIKTNIVAELYTPLDPSKNPTQEETDALKSQNLTAVEPLQKKILDWYKRADLLPAGLCAIRGRPDCRVGRCVLMPDQQMRFYCEGVRHNLQWSESPSYVTALNLVRGEPVKMKQA